MADKGDPVAATKSTTTPVAENVKRTVRKCLSTSPAYAYTFEKIEICFSDGILTLRGQLPSFYLKQVLQTLLRDVEGVVRIDNRVDVRELADAKTRPLVVGRLDALSTSR
jgi:hypothetical protein